MRKLPARKLLCAAIAGALFLPLKGFTLGLGEIEVNSALNQKLKADIELISATPEDAENIIVKLASRKEFTRAGLDRPYLLNDLRFKAVLADGVPIISVSSGSPVREPFLNFLVEVDWPNGHMVREYTVLLDPPVFMTQAASAAIAPAAPATTNNTSYRPNTGGSSNVVPVVAPGMSASSRPSASASAQSEAQAVKPQGASQSAVVPAPVIYQQQTSINQPQGSYRIKQGDTAWSLADAMRPDQSVSVEQMMIAMLRANPESFINENINGLKRGYILRIPDYNQIISIQQEDAKALVREQAALWRQYQQSQTGGQPASAMPSDDLTGSGSSDGSVITGEENDAYLEIVSAGSGSSTMSGKDPVDMNARELRAELALSRERVETERVEKEALQSRVDALEQSNGKMKGMLSIEDDAMSDVQDLNLPTDGEAAEVETTEADLSEIMAGSEEQLAEQDLQDALSDEAADDTAEAALDETDADELASDEPGAESADGDEEGADEEALFVDEAATEGTEDDMAADDAMDTAESLADSQLEPQPEPQIITRPPADPLTKLLNDPIMLAAGGGGLLLIAGLIALIIKRRKSADETEAPVMTLDDDAMDSLSDTASDTGTDTVAADTKAEAETAVSDDDAPSDNFDSDSTMILDSAEDTVVAESDPAAEAEEEPRDDVIAEADVYLAYGIYQQAEELLAQAITDNPDRIDYRVKLAETLYASKNKDAFVEVATEINKLEDGKDTKAWKKVMSMGQDLCADEAIFQGSMIGGLDVDSLAPNAPEMDFDLGLDEPAPTGDASPDLNLDDAPLELPEMDDSSADESQGSEAADDTVLADPANELEFDLSDTGAVEESDSDEDEFSLDIDASELDIDIDMVDEAAEPASAEDSTSEDDVLDVGDIDIDFGLDDESSEDSKADLEDEIAIDLSDDMESLDMDLGDDKADEPEAEAAVDEVADVATDIATDISVDDADDDDFDLSSLDDVDEINTKLDLARAYLDMGDHEGTRGILEEVIADGNDEQKQEANELMAKLDD